MSQFYKLRVKQADNMMAQRNQQALLILFFSAELQLFSASGSNYIIVNHSFLTDSALSLIPMCTSRGPYTEKQQFIRLRNTHELSTLRSISLSFYISLLDSICSPGWLEKEDSEPIGMANKPSIAPYSVAFCHSPTCSVEVAMENRNFLI